jgi:penicillin-binding protein 1C
VFSRATSSLVADILSDPAARTLEFGRGGVLEFPSPTAVKTGTSSDYRDAWAVGFSDRHTVGVWMGSLDRRPMDAVTGSVGPAFVLRSVFTYLRNAHGRGPLYLSRALRRGRICRVTGLRASPRCPGMDEWFREGGMPRRVCDRHGGTGTGPAAPSPSTVRMTHPVPGLELAMDPRIPDELEALRLEIDSAGTPSRTEWFVDGVPVGTTEGPGRSITWRLTRGEHSAHARVWAGEGRPPSETERVPFRVR